VSLELSGWKSKVDGLVRKLDHMSTGSKEKVVNEVNELHIIAEELSDRIDGLAKFCSTDWRAQKEDHNVIWPEQSGSTWNRVSQSDIGG
jgi:hypothetical protein